MIFSDIFQISNGLSIVKYRVIFYLRLKTERRKCLMKTQILLLTEEI